MPFMMHFVGREEGEGVFLGEVPLVVGLGVVVSVRAAFVCGGGWEC